ncbi:hypothetical protein GFL84_11840 [Rhizobium leguminosarum bv. viciae]|nr:hypothetical protein [Rhizobium leguminosarum bv. viciae]
MARAPRTSGASSLSEASLDAHRRLAEAAQRVLKGVVRLVSALVRRRCRRTTFTGSRAVKAPYRI